MTTINMMTTKEIDRRSEETGDQRIEASVVQSKHKTTRWQRRCRMAAIAGLGQRVTRAGTPDSARARVVKVLTELLGARGPRIRGAALQAMRRLGNSAKAAEEVVASLAEHDPEGRVRVAARAALKALQQEKPASAELDRLRGELDSLKKRNQDLADRLKKLEAK